MHYTFTIINKAASITALKQSNNFFKLHATLVTIIIKLINNSLFMAQLTTIEGLIFNGIDFNN